MVDKEMITEMLNTNPLSLLAIKDKRVIDEINNLVPYSSAFEIECDISSVYNVESFESIPDIMSVQNSYGEQRYRIPNGLRGIICLYSISYQLKINSLLNPLSGIHYHVDCTDCFGKIESIFAYSSKINNRNDKTDYILSELDTWLEGDKASARGYGSWFRTNFLGTLEFRLGEMTFDYRRILKRIIHVNKIVRELKEEIYGGKSQAQNKISFEVPDKKKIIDYYRLILNNITGQQNKILSLNKRLEEINSKNLTEKEVMDATEDIKSMYRNRVHLINKDAL